MKLAEHTSESVEHQTNKHVQDKQSGSGLPILQFMACWISNELVNKFTSFNGHDTGDIVWVLVASELAIIMALATRVYPTI